LKKKIDIIETVDGGNIWLSISKLIPFIEHVHCSQFTIKNQCELPIDLGTRIERKLQLISLRRAFAVISPSNAMLQIVENENRKKLKYKKQIPLCLNRGTAIQNNKNKTTRFIFASRNDALKGGNTLLKAIESANKEIEKKATFYFIGYEPCPNKEYPSNIIFKPFMPRNELLGFYPQCDVALLPSLFDNSPLFIYESMAAGLPVIATNVGGIPELIYHGKNGFLIEKGDIGSLSHWIIELVENPKIRKKMGNNARKFIMDYANVEKIANQKIKLYQSLIIMN
jgi:glycosyltransferase involved in cell wall biosynthesis